MSFLDSNGVAFLWDKIKKLIDATDETVTITDSNTGLSYKFIRKGKIIIANTGDKPLAAVKADTDYVFSEKLPKNFMPKYPVYRYTEVRNGRAVRTIIKTDGTVTLSTDFNAGTSTYIISDIMYFTY